MNTEWANALVRNDGADGSGPGGSWLFTPVPTAIDPAWLAQSTWADDDGDGDLDLLLQNVSSGNTEGWLKRFRNDGGGAFVGAPLLDFSDLDGMVDWADADSDGDLDVLVAGNLLDADDERRTVLRIYRNEGSGVYSPLTLAEGWTADWLDILAATWADYDSDGDVDVLATGSFIGEQEIEGHSKVYANVANSWTVLPLELPAPASSVGRGGAFTWLDLDGDGDLDYLVGGAYYVPNGNGLVEAKIKLYRNDPPIPNLKPSAPTGVQAQLVGDGETRLSWNAASDDHTPSSALTYDLKVRPAGAPAAAAARLPEPGKQGTGRSWTLDLPPGTYQYELCAVDSAYAPGAKATGTFTVGLPGIFSDGFETGSTGRWSAVVP